MVTMTEAALEKAIEFAIMDLAQTACDSPNEVLPKEEQIRSAMYAFFKNRGCIVHVEACRERCRAEYDLRVRFPDNREWWIEIKRAWSHSGWNNKPSEQKRTWQQDVAKLKRIPHKRRRLFVLFGVFDRGAEDPPCALQKAIVSFHKRNMVYHSGSKPFQWRDSQLQRLEAWAWRF